jgi:serine/threonine protein kinase
MGQKTSKVIYISDTAKKYPQNKDKYILGKQIGRGSFADVYNASVEETDEAVAVKIINFDIIKNDDLTDIKKEVSIMKLSHPNIMHACATFLVNQSLWIVMPFMDYGSCADIIKMVHPKGIKDEVLVISILKQLLEGLEHLHKNHVIHRDIKGGNILIDKNGIIKLADFGVSTILSENRKGARTFTGTPCWMAPEVLEQGDTYDQSADIWSFGIFILELLYGYPPHIKHDPIKAIMMILQEKPPTCDLYTDEKNPSSSFRKMLSKCLKKRPHKRHTVTQLLKCSLFKKAKGNGYVAEHLFKNPTREF